MSHVLRLLLFLQLIEYIRCNDVSTRHLMIRKIRPEIWGKLKRERAISIRGGSDASDESIGPDILEIGVISEAGGTREEEKITKPNYNNWKTRHSPKDLWDILKNHGDLNEESLSLREMIETRVDDYLLELHDETIKRPPSPLKVLHKMAPKIPAIKHSPDILLRIHTARGDIDSGVAASLIAVMARLCIDYENKTGKSISKDIIRDRRFEQLVECVNCGVDVRKRRLEAQKLMADGDDTEIEMEELLDEENNKIDEGLTVLDACRAAWGISMLGGYHLESFGGQKATDILTALSLRSREQLLARLQVLRTSSRSLEDDFHSDSGIIAKDVASSIWTFACVKACTGLRNVPLFEACCSILCQNPAALRDRELAKKSEDLEEIIAMQEGSNEKNGENNNIDEDRDALLHWLSPNEVADIMWAVAVHGRTDDSGSKQEMNLSETATALSEIAFDVIQGALKKDLTLIKKSESATAIDHDHKFIDNSHESDEVITKEYVKQDDGAVVEVVDASTLLREKSSNSYTDTITKTEDDTESEPLISENIEEVEVVDANALIASEQDGQQIEIDAEILYTKSSPVYSERNFNFNIQFTNNNLCSIAWAATDLQDSLRNILVDLIVDILAQQGSQSMKSLHGGNLSNLAWSIARRTRFEGYNPDGLTASRLMNIFKWITIRSLSFLEQNDEIDLLQYFQAPEIGRMMWSLAIAQSNLSQYTNGRRINRDVFHNFAVISLQTVVSQSSMFGTEDLARVVWGFLELSDLELVLRDPKVSAALGRILSIMEQSILRWESGQCEKQRRNQNATHIEEPVNFNSFLGMSRFALKFLNQRVDTNTYDDDEPQLSESEKVNLPLLRDLSMDPATMCKLAYSLSRTHVIFPEIPYPWTFVRVAVRLMAAKSGQLLRENTVNDNVRLAFGCASNTISGYGREIIARLYARRLVQYLNQKLSGKDYDFVSNRLGLSPREISTLVWSLGELGVKHWQIEEGVEGNAYKKLRLVHNVKLLPDTELKSLSTYSTLQLLHGTISMGFLKSSPDTIRSILHNLEMKLQSDIKNFDVCQLVECLARIKGMIGEVEVFTTSSYEITENATVTKNSKHTDSNMDDAINIIKREEKEDAINSAPDNVLSSEILISVNHILCFIAKNSVKSLHFLSANQMRRLLQAYIGLPFQVDAFINNLEAVIHKRLEAVKFLSTQRLADNATYASKKSSDALGDKSNESGAPLTTLRKGLKKLFSHSSETEVEDGDHDNSARLQEVDKLLKETESIYNYAPISNLINKSVENALSTEQRQAILELNRCQELIDSYRRVNFSTGKRRSRHDLRRREIGKSVVSRMLK